MDSKVILVDYEVQQKILQEIEAVKKLLIERHVARDHDGIRWLDNAELMEYLHVCRRTILKFRKKGLPSSQISGRIYYRKDLVDDFISNRRVEI